MHERMTKMANGLAILGGGVLCALVILTSLSVLGRQLNGVFNGPFMQANFTNLSNWFLDMGVGPINGDFELVEAGVAFAIFCFLPLAQITAGHASVDVFTSRLSPRFNRILAAVAEVLFAAVLLLIAVQLAKGMASKYGNGETSFLLQFPIWWAYAASLFGATAAAIVAIYVACIRVQEMATGRRILPEQTEAKT